MLTFDTYDGIRQHFRTIERHESRIYSFDGHRQSGKSWVSKRLAQDLNLPRIGTDDYRIKALEGRPYVDQLSFPDLTADIAKHASAGPVLIEGICIGWTLKRIDGLLAVPVTRIYCKRLTQAGLWADDTENYLDSNGMAEAGLGAFDTEVVNYHLETSPDLNAEITYSRLE